MSRAWAVAAATEATHVPAAGREAAAWRTRGWAEIAFAGLALAEHDEVAVEAFRGLDEVVRRVGIRYAGCHATRLRALRALAGPLPPYYLAAGRAAHPVAACVSPGRSPALWDACRAIGEFCDAVAEACPGEPSTGGTRQDAAADLRWGERHRPSPCGAYTIVRTDRCGGLAGRCWMRLPSPAGPRNVYADVPRRAAPLQERIWRGVHEGAHLDHLAATPLGVEFGYGLMAAETYAMAVEVLATVSCVLAGDLEEARWLRVGLAERVGRLPGYGAWLASAGPVPAALRAAATRPSPDFAPLPRLAAVYVRGPLLLLGGHDLGPLAPYLPASLTGPLLDRWAAARASFPPAAALTGPPRRA
ncbi:hypothetical protein GCM10009677_45760 [Sphaerisporangium rubeum]|uniref:hypothetical protein n=1 Tax=Sphaerisporangium rubeum TaxID=321317 RepID=UPI0031DEC6DB